AVREVDGLRLAGPALRDVAEGERGRGDDALGGDAVDLQVEPVLGERRIVRGEPQLADDVAAGAWRRRHVEGDVAERRDGRQRRAERDGRGEAELGAVR